MLRNNKGFTLIEVLISASMIFLMMTTILPITSLLEKERTVLNERRLLTAQLHDELQYFLWENLALPATYSKSNQGENITFDFTNEKKVIKGCVTWKNARGKNERSCLYGYK